MLANKTKQNNQLGRNKGIGTWPSAKARSRALRLTGQPLWEHAPLKQSTAEKNLCYNATRPWHYSKEHLSSKKEIKLNVCTQRDRVHPLIPPKIKILKVQKELNSTSLILCSYFLCLSFSSCQYRDGTEVVQYDDPQQWWVENVFQITWKGLQWRFHSHTITLFR